MALLIESTTSVATAVADAVVATYEARRDKVKLMSLAELVAGSVAADLSGVAAIVAAEHRVAEIVAADGLDLERLAAAAWTLDGRGWDVTVLVPCDRIGDAHASLRAAPCRLQPWWQDEAGVWFGAFETP